MHQEFKYLIIEDSLKVCEGITERMEKFNKWAACKFAHHVEEAKSIIENERPQLIFIDWALKGGSAYEVLARAEAIPHYHPYIIFNTGYQSENPQIPQEIFNNYKIDKYIIKPIWENLRLHLASYITEAENKHLSSKEGMRIFITDVYKRSASIDIRHLVCICIHHENPYLKTIHLNNGSSIHVKASWKHISELLQKYSLNYFITNHKEHTIIKEHIEVYKRPFVKLKSFPHKIEVVRDKLADFEKWLAVS